MEAWLFYQKRSKRVLKIRIGGIDTEQEANTAIKAYNIPNIDAASCHDTK